jgi:hypothetical protein
MKGSRSNMNPHSDMCPSRRSEDLAEKASDDRKDERRQRARPRFRRRRSAGLSFRGLVRALEPARPAASAVATAER